MQSEHVYAGVGSRNEESTQRRVSRNTRGAVHVLMSYKVNGVSGERYAVERECGVW